MCVLDAEGPCPQGPPPYDQSQRLIRTTPRKGAMALGELELTLLSVLRRAGEMTPSELHEAVRKRRKIAYTSVTTTLYRLRQKGLVSTHVSPTGRVLYTAEPGSPSGRGALAEIVGRLVDAFGEASVSHAVDARGVHSKQELAALERQVRERRAVRRKRGE